MSNSANEPKNHHFVPKMYLKRWGNGDKNDPRVFVFRKLIDSEEIIKIEPLSINDIACWTFGYSRVLDGEITHEFETWFGEDVESPAERAINSIVERNQKFTGLATTTKKQLLKFIMVQMMRTPSYYIRNYENMRQAGLDFINDPKRQKQIINNANKRYKSTGLNPVILPCEGFSLEITCPQIPCRYPEYKIKSYMGRVPWLAHIKRMIIKHLSFFEQLNWDIVQSTDTVEWITSDNPVVCICKDGSLLKKTNGLRDIHKLLFPVSPKHLIYACVENPKLTCAFQNREDFSLWAWDKIFENAMREVYSKTSQEDKFKNHTRTVTNTAYLQEEKMVKDKWHEDNMVFEVKYFPKNE